MTFLIGPFADLFKPIPTRLSWKNNILFRSILNSVKEVTKAWLLYGIATNNQHNSYINFESINFYFFRKHLLSYTIV